MREWRGDDVCELESSVSRTRVHLDAIERV